MGPSGRVSPTRFPSALSRCMQVLSRRRTAGYAVALGLSLIAVVGASSRMHAASAIAPATTDDSAGPSLFASTSDAVAFVDDSLRGLSGKLLARFVGGSTTNAYANSAFAQLFGSPSRMTPGVYAVTDSTLAHPFAFIDLVPFAEKQQGRVGGYRIGYWPGERESVADAYANPAGFIEVTPENEDTRISQHFRLRDFLTHDQRDVWPKYLVLREQLVDKLELVIQELEAEGHPVRHVTVMSGFRTPQYNASGGITTGRAEMSRHMYGDASDVFVDNDYNG